MMTFFFVVLARFPGFKDFVPYTWGNVHEQHLRFSLWSTWFVRTRVVPYVSCNGPDQHQWLSFLSSWRDFLGA